MLTHRWQRSEYDDEPKSSEPGTKDFGLESLEARLALSAPELPGNTGEVLQSQFAPFGFTKAIGLQASQLAVGGPIQFDLQVLSNLPETSGGTQAVEFSDNSGLIGYSQFSGGGFATVGMQIDSSRASAVA